MTKLLATTTLLLTLFVSPLMAKEIIMKCGNEVFKYSSGFFSKKVEIREKAGWVKWCTMPEHILEVKDRGAVCAFPKGIQDYANEKEKIMGDYVLDFIGLSFVTNHNEFTDPTDRRERSFMFNGKEVTLSTRFRKPHAFSELSCTLM